MENKHESKGLKRMIKGETESNKKGKFELGRQETDNTLSDGTDNIDLNQIKEESIDTPSPIRVKEEHQCVIKAEPSLVKEESATLSWAEQYEQMKRERLAKDEALKPKSLGFVSSPVKNEQTSAETFSSVVIKTEQVSKNEVTFDSAKNYMSQNVIRSEAAKPTDNPVVIDPCKNVDKDHSSKETSPLPSKKTDDPWLVAYEAKKEAALKNLKEGILQSVSGTSAFCGKIDHVSHLSKSNQVTKLMDKFKRDGVKSGKKKNESTPTQSKPAIQHKLACDKAKVDTNKKASPPAPSVSVKPKVGMQDFGKLLKQTKIDSVKSSEDWQSEYESRKAALANSSSLSLPTKNAGSSSAEPSKPPPRGFSSKPIGQHPPASSGEFTQPKTLPSLFDQQIQPPSNNKASFSNKSSQRATRPDFPGNNRNSNIRNVAMKLNTRVEHSGQRWSGVSEPKTEGGRRWSGVAEVKPQGGYMCSSMGERKAEGGQRWSGVSELKTGEKYQNKGSYEGAGAKQWHADVLTNEQTKPLVKNNQQGVAYTGPSAFGKKPPPPPGQLAISGFGDLNSNASSGPFNNQFNNGRLKGGQDGRSFNHSNNKSGLNPGGQNSCSRDNQNSPVGRPTCPTPRSYGTNYGGPPTPGPNPSKAFQPPGFVPPTPPGGNLNKFRFGRGASGNDGPPTPGPNPSKAFQPPGFVPPTPPGGNLNKLRFGRGASGNDGFGSGGFNHVGSGFGRGGSNNTGPGFGRGGSSNSGPGFGRGGSNNTGPGFGRGGSSNSGPGRGGSNNTGPGFGRGGSSNSGPGFGRGGSSNSGLGFGSGPSSNIGPGFGKGRSSDEGEGFKSPNTCRNNPPFPSYKPPVPGKAPQSFQQQMKNVTADSKKDASTWQAEYEAKKRARLGGGL